MKSDQFDAQITVMEIILLLFYYYMNSFHFLHSSVFFRGHIKPDELHAQITADK